MNREKLENNEKKRILQIGPSIYNSKGGMTTVINQLYMSKEINKKYDISVYSSYVDGNILKRILFSIYSYILFLFIYKKYDVFHIHLASYGSTFRKGLYINTIDRYNQKIRKKYSNDNEYIQYKKKIILHLHGGAYDKFYYSLNSLKQNKVFKLWEKADDVIVLSKEWQDFVFRVFEGEIKNISIINNAVKQAKIDNINIKEKLLSFIFVGRITKEKGIYELCSAIKELITKYPNIKLYIAGSGEEEGNIKSYIDKNNLQNNIELLGWIKEEKQIKYYNKVATLILPSYYEGLPMVVLEAMAKGKNIIATSVGAIPEVVTEENGIIIKAKDTEMLKNAIERTIKNNINGLTIDEVSKNNIKLIREKYSLDIFIKKVNEIYIKVLK